MKATLVKLKEWILYPYGRMPDPLVPPEINTQWVLNSQDPFEVERHLQHAVLTVLDVREGHVKYMMSGTGLMTLMASGQRLDADVGSCRLSTFREVYIPVEEARARLAK